MQNPEHAVESDKETNLSEVQFDRRREAIDEKTATNRVTEGMIAIGEVLKETPSNASAPVRSSIQPQPPQSDTPLPVVPNLKSMFSYKKALVVGMGTGVIVALLVIFLYVR